MPTDSGMRPLEVNEFELIRKFCDLAIHTSGKILITVGNPSNSPEGKAKATMVYLMTLLDLVQLGMPHQKIIKNLNKSEILSVTPYIQFELIPDDTF